MTDMAVNEIIVSPKGDHFRFISVEETEAEANEVCERLLNLGYQSATFQNETSKKWEAYQKFLPVEECLFIFESACAACASKATPNCVSSKCNTKGEIDDITWKAQLGFHRLIAYKLKKLRGKATKQE